MGIIIRQSIKGTIYTYLGAILGLINMAFLLPSMVEPEVVGLVTLIISYASIFSQFSSLGFTSVTTRMFTYFRNRNKQHNGFFFLLLVVGLSGFLISFIAFKLFKPILIEDSLEKSALLVDYLYYILPLVFFQLFFSLFDNYYKVLYNATFGTFTKEFLLRLMVTICILLYFYKIISFDQFVLYYLIAFASPTIFIFFKLLIEKEIILKPDFSLLDKKMIKTIASVAFFGIILSFSGVAAQQIDRLMINSYLGLELAGIYAIVFYFGTIILMPNKSLHKISSVIIADAWKNNDLKEIRMIYSKSCMNQLIIGVLLFIGIWGNVHNIFQILPEAYESGKYVIFFIGLFGLVKMSRGVSDSIIANSKYYRYLSYFMLIYILAIVASNYFLIPEYGMTGAAIASLIAVFLFSLMKFLFLLFKYKLQPYNYKYLLVLATGILTYYLATLIPVIEYYILDIIIRSTFMAIVFSVIILLLKVSKDANAIFILVLKFIKITK